MNKLNMESKDIVGINIEHIGKLFPNVIVESDKGKSIDFDLLKQELSREVVDDRKEKYELTWPGKKESIVEANTPTKNTLIPERDKSVDFDNTKNIYIEGDNLEALKILQNSYLNKIKCIYIDPPYNTGNDFIYKDNFKKDSNQELEESGQIDDEGNRLVVNSSSNGRFHSDWLSMMYPRLKLARNLLADDGIILISIDENEIVNILRLCNDIFGETNFVENFIWIKNSTKNLSKTTSTNHEYVVCFSKNKECLSSSNWLRIEKPGLFDVNKLLDEANKEHLSFSATERMLKEYYNKHPELKGISNYNHVDYGPKNASEQKKLRVYTLDNASAPKSTGTGPKYSVIHPVTGKPCKNPSTGWRFTKSTMDDLIANNLIYFYKDENNVPRYKRYLDTVTTEVMKSTIEDFNDGKKDLLKLFDNNCPFDNPKPVSLIKRFTDMLSNDDILLDFFSGSTTSAHAILYTGALENKKIKYIMVQYPEKCEENSEAYKAGYKTICDIGEERIRRAGKKIKEETNANIDYGFKVYKIDSSNMKDSFYVKPSDLDQEQLKLFESNIKDDRTPEDLLTQVMLDLGLSLDLKIEKKNMNNNQVFFVENNSLVACFDDELDFNIIDEIASTKPLRVVFKDSSFDNDNDKINLEEKFKKISPETEIRVL